MQKIREAEQSSLRRALVLPSPQVGEAELEEIVKMGIVGERANMIARSSENDATRGLINNYATVNSGAPIRTPRAPAEEDRIANEIKNIRALTETQSSLLGGENTPLHEGVGSTGFDGITPRRQTLQTPNPMATPLRSNGVGSMGPPSVPGATPMRTPRDSFALNADGDMQLVGSTPRDIRLQEVAQRNQLRRGLASLPKPKDTEWELELPEEQQESFGAEEISEEDAELRDRRNQAIKEAQEKLDFSRRTQVMQRGLPRPTALNIETLLIQASQIQDSGAALVAREAALLQANDMRRFPRPGSSVRGTLQPLQVIDDDALAQARLLIDREVPEGLAKQGDAVYQRAWDAAHTSSLLPGLSAYADDEDEERQLIADSFDVSY
jgi:pre-mRNA-splicing factor CDC5/CEF1